MRAQPNILMVTTDEERQALPRPPGFSLPARERIADGGVTFVNYYAASVMCSSSRSVIYTGQHVPITQIFDNDNMPYIRPLDPGLGTIGRMLRQQGYYCTFKGKWHLSNAYEAAEGGSTEDLLEPYGFSEWNQWGDIDGGAWAGLRIDPVIAGQAAQWLRDRAPVVGDTQPWFMAVNFVNPHDIMSFDYGGRSSVPLPPNLAHAMVVRPPADIPIYRQQWDVELPPSRGDDLAGAAPAVREYASMLDVTFGPVSGEEHWREGLNFYLNCTRDVDRHVGVVLDALEASGQADRTIVVFTSDHGEMAGSHGLRQKANLVYDENFHVPLIIRHPDGGERVTNAMASAVDLAPTLLEFAGVDPAAIREHYPNLHGVSLVPAMDGGSVREGVLTAVESITTLDADFWTHFGDADAQQRIQDGSLRPDWDKRGFLRGYTDSRYTFGRYFAPLDPNRPGDVDTLLGRNDVVLYDRATDPEELVNLAADVQHRELVDQYRGKLEDLITAEIGADDQPWVSERPRLLGWPAAWRGDKTN